MKHAEEIMRILEAFDLTQSYRAAGELAGCDHHTVAQLGGPSRCRRVDRDARRGARS